MGGDNDVNAVLSSPVAPKRSISTPQQEDIPSHSRKSAAAPSPTSASGAVPEEVLRVLQTQERTISSQQQTLLRLEAEMQKLMAANSRLVDTSDKPSSPVATYHSPKRVPISISPYSAFNGASTAAATPVRNDSQSRYYDALYTDPQQEVAAITLAVAASEREKVILEMSPPRGGRGASGEESVPYSIHSSPVGKPIASVDGTADSSENARRQQGLIDAQQQQLWELEQQLAKLRANSAASALASTNNSANEESTKAQREGALVWGLKLVVVV
jgi:hypothetical protein